MAVRHSRNVANIRNEFEHYHLIVTVKFQFFSRGENYWHLIFCVVLFI